MFRPRGRGERGAVAVEAALVTPILFLLVLGIIEMSLYMRDTISVTSSVRTGGRFGQYGWDIVGQKATVTRLSSSAPITRYPVVGEVFALPTIPPNGPLSSPRPHP